jgi:hypothetical protein
MQERNNPEITKQKGELEKYIWIFIKNTIWFFFYDLLFIFLLFI